jgi:hypothetical protein
MAKLRNRGFTPLSADEELINVVISPGARFDSADIVDYHRVGISNEGTGDVQAEDK